jgi:phosphopantothenoylcysteine decarboxylase
MASKSNIGSNIMANMLLGVTGSVAAIYTKELFEALHAEGHAVKVVATEAARYFFDAATLGEGAVTFDADEWPVPHYRRGDPVLHIELRRWAALLLIAPLDANTLAKLALGLADNCLTCVYRAWDRSRPVVLAPAMNTLMWEHPATARHLRQIAEDMGAGTLPAGLSLDEIVESINGQPAPLRIVAPIAKRLACDDVGVGAMAERDAILRALRALNVNNEKRN